MGRRETNLNSRDNSAQFGEVHGDVKVNIQPKGRFGFLSTGCIAVSGLILVASVVVLILSLTAGLSFLQTLAAPFTQGYQPAGPGTFPTQVIYTNPTQSPPQIPVTSTQVVLAQSTGDVSGLWMLLFYDQAWGYSYYYLNLTRAGSIISGTSRVVASDNPSCYMDFSVVGEVLDETNGVHLRLQEDYQPVTCQVYGSAGDAKDIDLTYTNGLDGEWLKGSFRSRTGMYEGTMNFNRPTQ